MFLEQSPAPMKETAGHWQECVSEGSFTLEKNLNCLSGPCLISRSPFSLEGAEGLPWA